MLEFKENRYGMLGAKFGNWRFQINNGGHGQERWPFWVVAVFSDEKSVTILDTDEHQHFSTVEAAAGFCEALADGTTSLGEIRAKYAAEDAAKEQATIRAAAERAKAFRAKLEALGISYTILLDLMDQQINMDDLDHRLLLGFERGEGWPYE